MTLMLYDLNYRDFVIDHNWPLFYKYVNNATIQARVMQRHDVLFVYATVTR